MIEKNKKREEENLLNENSSVVVTGKTLQTDDDEIDLMKVVGVLLDDFGDLKNLQSEG